MGTMPCCALRCTENLLAVRGLLEIGNLASEAMGLFRECLEFVAQFFGNDAGKSKEANEVGDGHECV